MSPEENFDRNWLIVRKLGETCLSHQAGKQIFRFSVKEENRKGEKKRAVILKQSAPHWPPSYQPTRFTFNQLIQEYT